MIKKLSQDSYLDTNRLPSAKPSLREEEARQLEQRLRAEYEARFVEVQRKGEQILAYYKNELRRAHTQLDQKPELSLRGLDKVATAALQETLECYKGHSRALQSLIEEQEAALAKMTTSFEGLNIKVLGQVDTQATSVALLQSLVNQRESQLVQASAVISALRDEVTSLSNLNQDLVHQANLVKEQG